MLFPSRSLIFQFLSHIEFILNVSFSILYFYYFFKHFKKETMKKVNKQCLLDTPRTVRVSEKTWQVIVRTRRPQF